MDREIRGIAAIALVALSLGASPARAGEAAPLRAGELLGREVHDAAAAPAGTVRDLFIDPMDHRIAGLALDLGGRPRVCEVKEIAFAGEGPAAGPKAVRLPPGCEEGDGIAVAPSWRRATDLMKAKVRDRAGAEVGDVKDLYVDAANARVTHALVDFVPQWFEGDGWAAVPIGSLRPEGRGYVAAFDPQALRPAAEAGKAAAPARPQPADARLSSLLGRAVATAGGERDGQDQKVGRLREVVVTLATGRLHYLVADFVGGWVQDGQLVALPRRPVELGERGRPFVRANLMELQSRPVFPEKRLDDVWSPVFANGMQQYLYGK